MASSYNLTAIFKWQIWYFAWEIRSLIFHFTTELIYQVTWHHLNGTTRTTNTSTTNIFSTFHSDKKGIKNSLLAWTTILKMELNPTEIFPVCAAFVVKSGELPSRVQPTLCSFYLSRSYALCCQPRKQDKRYMLFHISATRSSIQKPVKAWLDTRQCIERVLGWPCFILFSPAF